TEGFTTRQRAGLVPPDARGVCGIEHIHVDAEEEVIRAAGDLSDPGECPVRPAAAHHARRQLGKSDLVDEALGGRKVEAPRTDLHASSLVDARQLERAPHPARMAVTPLRG